MKAAICGIGWVNAAGWGKGRDALFRTAPGEAARGLPGKEVLGRPFARYGRMDIYSRLGVSAIALALGDAGLDRWDTVREIALIGATSGGSLPTDGLYLDDMGPGGGHLASPALFAYTLPNTYLGEAAIHFGLTGASFVLSEAPLTGMTALGLALTGMAFGIYETVIVGACDAGTGPVKGLYPSQQGGALFFLLKRGGLMARHSYEQEVCRNGDGIFYGDVPVKDLFSLAATCTTPATKAKREDDTP